MAETKLKKQPPKIADITKPSKAAANGRPIIIANRTVLQDPMMVQDTTENEADSGTQAPATVSHMSHSIKIQPLHDEVKADATPGVPAVAASVGAGKTIAVLAEEAAERKASKETAPKESEPADESKDDAATEKSTDIPTGAPAVETEKPEATKSKTVIEPPVTEKVEETPEAAAAPEPEKSEEKPQEKPEEKPAEPAKTNPDETELPLGEDAAEQDDDSLPADTNLSEEAQREMLAKQKLSEEQEKIIMSGKYYLPIDAVAHRRTKRHIVLGLALILLLAVALFLAAWDANFFSIPGYSAPTNYL